MPPWYAIVAIVLMVSWPIWFIVRNSRKNDEITQRLAAARPARAVLLRVGDSGHSRRLNETYVEIGLEVHEDGQAPREVTVRWVVLPASVAKLVEGAEIDVSVDATDPGQVYPRVDWLRVQRPSL